MFNPGILIGDIISENDVHRIFGCQTTFGIRLNKKNNAIIIVSDANGKEYADYWDEDIFYYTGTDAGAIDGNQTLTGPGNNNGALKAVWDAPEETTLFLFVKYAPNQCTYKGIVRLVQEPYQETRRSNPSQKVWKFPLKLVDVGAEKIYSDCTLGEVRVSLTKSETEMKNSIKKRLKNLDRIEIVKRTSTVTVYDRDPELSAYVKVRANGRCDLCRDTAPFIDEHGRPYLEAHHIIWLSKGGTDDPQNVVALCPNCHRKIHILDLDADKELLLKRIEEYLFQKK